jgi:hypothetical protein
MKMIKLFDDNLRSLIWYWTVAVALNLVLAYLIFGLFWELFGDSLVVLRFKFGDFTEGVGNRTYLHWLFGCGLILTLIDGMLATFMATKPFEGKILTESRILFHMVFLTLFLVLIGMIVYVSLIIKINLMMNV